MRLLLLVLTSLSLATSPLLAQGSTTTDSSGVWRSVDEQAMLSATAARGADVDALRNIVPQTYRTVEADRAALAELLDTAPLEFTSAPGAEILLPMPDGTFARFHVQESPIVEPALAKKFPEIKTYVAQGIDDPTATARLDLTPAGFHAMILSPQHGATFIDPYWRDSDTVYVSYRKGDYSADKPFQCLVDTPAAAVAKQLEDDLPARPTGAQLRRYRLAVACTGEYAVAVSSPNPATVPRALAAIITTVNRVSAIYERDIAIRLLLIANNDRLVYLNGSTDPYSNNDGIAMLGQNQSTIDSVIGAANYDIGHVFSTGGGGVAYLGVPCTTSKAGGVTGQSAPWGDPFDVDYVAHEMGHQFGAEHTFNSTIGSCNGNRNGPTAFETGSGTTIMAYAGICATTTVNTNLAANSDDYFHTGSYTEMDNFTTTGAGANCPTSVGTGNNPPVIAALPASYTIPANTPFALTASATDANGDTITYAWEQYDGNGTAQSTQNPSSTTTSGPLFRSFPPKVNPTRVFPSLIYILNNGNTPPATNASGFATGEILPTVARTMNFRVTARDNRAGGGGSDWASTAVTTVATGAAFQVTAPNTALTYAGGSQQTVAWNVAGTTGSGINTANVRILLSTDGGYTFPTVLASTVANNGSAVVTIPQIATTQGRIKVEAIGNIFFDISNANFTITSTNTAPTVSVTGSLTVSRGRPTATVGTVASASDANGDALSATLSDVPWGATVTPTISGSSVSLSAVVDCAVVTTLSSRTYPIVLTVTDVHGARTSATVNLVVTSNPSPTLGTYPNISVSVPQSATSAPSAPAADTNGNLAAAPYSVLPTTLPGGGTISVNQSTGVVTVSTTSTSTLGTTAVRVTALDSCGAAAVSTFNVTVANNNPVLQSGTSSAPTTESCSPVNNAVDPGETVTVNLPINNTGGGATSNLVATLQNSGGITAITTSQNYGAIAANGTTSRAFQFVANGTCGATVTATLQLQDGTTNYGIITYTIRLGALSTTTLLAQNFDGVTAPALPSGWAATATATPAPSPTPWATNTTTPDTAANAIVATPLPRISDNQLTSPSVNIPAGAAQLSFRHRWNLEEGYDGGIVEISINGAAFQNITAAGGEFTAGAYNGNIPTQWGNPIGGSAAWTGSFNGSYTTSTVNLPAAALGQSVRFRWRLGTDNTTSPNGAVWRVDTISVTGSSYVCSVTCGGTAPAFTSSLPPSPLTVGTAYSHTFTASGQPAPTFSLTSGTLPPGLTLSSSGVLSGTPTSAGTGTFPNITVTASNGNAPAAQQTFTLNVQTSATNYLASYGVTGPNSGLAEDFDFDGILNLVEYALGLHPNSASVAGLPVIVPQDYNGTRYLSMTFRRSSVARDLSYIVQGSSNLLQWDDLATSTAGGAPSGPGFVQETGSAPEFMVEVRDTVPMNSAPEGKRFLRLRIVPQ